VFRGPPRLYALRLWLKRMLMRRIARKEGGPTDTSRDHELTNWTEVTALAIDIAALARAPVAS
jgi:menaquinone-dependent protoporphyrinogen IX oxidase